MTAKIRIVAVDDQTLFVHMLKTVLETRSDEFDVVGIAGNGRDALKLIEELKPDVVLMDISMPVLDGVRTARELVKRGDAVKIVMLTTFDDNVAIHEALAVGVGGYILKDCSPEELFAAIKSVYAGSTSLSPSVVKKLVSREGPDHAGGTGGQQTAQTGAAVPLVSAAEVSIPGALRAPVLSRDRIAELLNRREQEILALIAEGLENREIADKLFIAEQTVKNNISSMYEKLGVHDRSKLVKTAEYFVSGK